MMVYLWIMFVSFNLIVCQEKWSPKEEDASFEPVYTVLENWTSIAERNEKIIKTPVPCRGRFTEVFDPSQYSATTRISRMNLEMIAKFTLHPHNRLTDAKKERCCYDQYAIMINSYGAKNDTSYFKYRARRPLHLVFNPYRHIVNNRPVREPPSTTNSKEVSETDLFLLGAIEKLAYRMDFMEKRLQKTEQMLYRVVAGNQFNEKVDPCPEHFNRYGGACFHVSTKQLNWKSASSTCRNLGAVLLEFESPEEENVLLASLQIDSSYKGKDYWTGGLNPGLLWIWSNSAKPILSDKNQSMDIKQIEGNGRCLLMSYQPPTKNYRYKGAECSMRHYFICRYLENATGRQLERLDRALRSRSVGH